MNTKTCSKCGATKPHSEFGNRKSARDGKRSECKACGCAYAKAWAKANPERRQANQDKWSRNRSVETQIKDRTSNTYQRIKRLGIQIVDEELTLLVTEEIHAKNIELEELTGIRWSLDHTLPLALGGVHCHDNIRCLPLTVNLSKANLGEGWYGKAVYNVTT